MKDCDKDHQTALEKALMSAAIQMKGEVKVETMG